jgi:hypothetical protein
MPSHLIATVTIVLAMCLAPLHAHADSAACTSDRELYFWYVIAESQPGRPIYYSPRDQDAYVPHMGLEAALQSCEREDCIVGISADSDDEAIDMLKTVCDRRIRPDAYRHIQVHLFLESSASDISDRFAGCATASIASPEMIGQLLKQTPETIEDVRCND